MKKGSILNYFSLMVGSLLVVSVSVKTQAQTSVDLSENDDSGIARVYDSVNQDLIPESYTYYYVSNDGNDFNSGTSEGSSWATISKVQEKMDDGTLGAGDAILFKANDIFKGTLNIDGGGTDGNPLYIGAYGEGLKPVFSNADTLTSFTDMGNNIWRASLGANNTPQLVFVDGVRFDIAQLPAGDDYYRISQTGDRSTCYSDEIGGLSWSDMDEGLMYVYSQDYWPQVVDIQGYNTTYITTAEVKGYGENYKEGYYFKIIGDPDLLTDNTFAFNGSYLYIKKASQPTQVITTGGQGSETDGNINPLGCAIFINGSDNITIDNIDFQFHDYGVSSTTYQQIRNLSIRNCHFQYIDEVAVSRDAPQNGEYTNFLFDGNYCDWIGSFGIELGEVNNSSVNNNTFKNISLFVGAMLHRNTSGSAMSMDNMYYDTITYNVIDSVVHRGVSYLCDDYGGNVISYNIISNFALRTADCAAIYGFAADDVYGRNTISYNIISNGWKANIEPISPGNKEAVMGIYSDEYSQGVDIENNTIFNVNRGVYHHGAEDIHVSNNTIFNPFIYGLSWHSAKYTDIELCKAFHNTIVAFDPDVKHYDIRDQYMNNPSRYPKIDFNDLVKINSNADVLYETQIEGGYPNWTSNLSQMQNKHGNYNDVFYNFDKNKHCILLVNPLRKSRELKLPVGEFKDFYENTYSETVTLAPFESIVLHTSNSAKIAESISQEEWSSDSTLGFKLNSNEQLCAKSFKVNCSNEQQPGLILLLEENTASNYSNDSETDTVTSEPNTYDSDHESFQIISQPPLKAFTDSIYKYTLQLSEYSNSDINFEVIRLPSWMSLLEENIAEGYLVIEGMPATEHVAKTNSVEIIAYSNTTEIVHQFSIEVIKKEEEPGSENSDTTNIDNVATDDPSDKMFDIVSQPSLVAFVDSLYTYKLEVSGDNKSSIDFEMVTLPSWLSIEEKNATEGYLIIMGIPAAEHITGATSIEIIISNESFEKVHQYDVEVMKMEEELNNGINSDTGTRNDNDDTSIPNNSTEESRENRNDLSVVDNIHGDTIIYSISSSEDDAEEYANGIVSTTNKDLELVTDYHNHHGNQTVGLIFRNIQIPSDKNIMNAYIRFAVDEAKNAQNDLLIEGLYNSATQSFKMSKNNISKRPRTRSKITWQPDGWNHIDTFEYSVDVINIIDDIISNEGWVSGDNIGFVITGVGRLIAKSYEGAALKVERPSLILVLQDEQQYLQTDINTFENHEIKLYPNPVSDIITINLPNEKIISATIYNLKGQTIVKESFFNVNTAKLSLSDLYSGVYVINIITNKGTLYRRQIIKE